MSIVSADMPSTPVVRRRPKPESSSPKAEMSDSSKWADNFERKIQDLKPKEQEAVRKFWRSVVMRNAPRVFGEENGRLPQLYADNAANVRSCNCCPYGYHIDLDFVRYCEALANAKPSEEQLQRRSRRRSRKSMEFMLGLDGLFEQWDAAVRVQAVPEAPHESDSPDSSRISSARATLQKNMSTCTTPYEQRPRSASMPRFTAGATPRAESPFGTASSTCSSVRGAESDAPYSMLRQRSPYRGDNGCSTADTPEKRAFLHDALDEVCSDFELTLERASMRRKRSPSCNSSRLRSEVNGKICGGISNGSLPYGQTGSSFLVSDRNNNHDLLSRPLLRSKTSTTLPINSNRNHMQLFNGFSRNLQCDILDSCVTGKKSTFDNALPSLQPQPSPAEQQYESYVQATVAANAKSPVEINTTTITTTLKKITSTTTRDVTPPPPPLRRHALQEKLLSPPTAAVTNTTISPLKSTTSEVLEDSLQLSNGNESVAIATYPQTFYNIRQQMAFSLKSMKDMEVSHELTQLRDEKQRLQQSLQRKEEQLRAREAAPPSNTPSPVASVKGGSQNGQSPVSFTPQRISPVSLESLGARLRTNSSSSERQLRSTLRREVGTMCGLHATRDIAVGSPIVMQRSVGTSPQQQLPTITEMLYSQYELEQRIEVAMRTYEEQRIISQKQKLISVGTQLSAPLSKSRESAAQTEAVPEVRRSSVGVSAKPQTCDNYVSCRPEVRTIGCSDDTIKDVLCERCRVLKRSVACSTEDAAFQQVRSVSLKQLEKPLRSNTFALGEHESAMGRIRKSTGTQCVPPLVHHFGIQTAPTQMRSATVQCAPEQQHREVQCVPQSTTQKTDTRDLIRLCSVQTNTDQIKPAPEVVVKPTVKTSHAACNTDAPARTVDSGMNTLPSIDLDHSTASIKQVDKRDVSCGDIVKPHILIACADNYCDSCKDTIKNLAKDFSKVSSPPATPHTSLRSTSMDSRIPRPKHITSPSPVRRVFQRQNTFTVLSPPSTASEEEKKETASSLTEKPPLASFHDAASRSSETQSFITEPKITDAASTAGVAAVDKRRNSNSNVKRTEELQAKSAAGSSHSVQHYAPLIVKEETRVSTTWSRDASPASPTRKDSGSSGSTQRSLNTSLNEKLKEADSASTNSTNTTNSSSSAATVVEQPVAADVSKGARKKTTLPIPTKTKQLKPPSQSSVKKEEHQKSLAQEATAAKKPQQEPSKAMLQKLAMVEAKPRQKVKPPAEMLCALKIINDSLLKKVGAKSLSSQSLKSAKLTIQQEWFRISSTEDANPHVVEDYLDYFEELSVPLLEYCVNMVDANGNTAMHYSVSHGNFDVVSILLDSKVCNVNQMNNAGYTCVMLVSLTKLKNTAHRTVVQRLFQMADVNIRAKKHSQTALMLAVSHFNMEMVQLLLEAGADINIQDDDGSTALMGAAEIGRVDMVKQLLSQPDCDSLITDADGATAFKIAWQAGHREIGFILYVHEQMLRNKSVTSEEHPMNTSYTLPGPSQHLAE